jgi:hypothetical protein
MSYSDKNVMISLERALSMVGARERRKWRKDLLRKYQIIMRTLLHCERAEEQRQRIVAVKEKRGLKEETSLPITH